MISGQLDDIHLGDLLQWFKMSGMSGRMTFDSRPWKRHLDLVDGRIVYVASDHPRQRLGSWLADRGVAPARVLRRCLGLSLLRRTLFSDELIDSGAVSAETLKQSIRDLAGVVIKQTLAAGVSDFVMDTAYPVRDLLGLDLDLDPQNLLLDAARQMDEDGAQGLSSEGGGIPFSGEEFETFFWELLTTAVPPEDPVHGAEIAELHDIVQHVMRTIAGWVTSSPGLVPWPSSQAAEAERQWDDGASVCLEGLPHAAWNQMVLACTVRGPSGTMPENMAALNRASDEIDLWKELVRAERWRREKTPRLDSLTTDAVREWTEGASAAGAHFGVDPGEVALAAHILVVPTDLVLWVLTSVPIAHHGVRKALLGALPPRIGAGLASRADFPRPIIDILGGWASSPLAAALHVGGAALSNPSLWPVVVPEDDDMLLKIVSPEQLAASRRAVGEIEQRADASRSERDERG